MYTAQSGERKKSGQFPFPPLPPPKKKIKIKLPFDKLIDDEIFKLELVDFSKISYKFY